MKVERTSNELLILDGKYALDTLKAVDAAFKEVKSENSIIEHVSMFYTGSPYGDKIYELCVKHNVPMSKYN